MQIYIRGANRLASIIGTKLYRYGHQLTMGVDKDYVPTEECFGQAVKEGSVVLWKIEGRLVTYDEIDPFCVNILVGEEKRFLKEYLPDIFIDASFKEEVDYTLHLAPIVIGIGKGICAATDVHFVIDTRKESAGEALYSGSLSENGEGLTDQDYEKIADGVLDAIMRVSD
ncbi:hypothetical protein [Guggenheimella bovis]